MLTRVFFTGESKKFDRGLLYRKVQKGGQWSTLQERSKKVGGGFLLIRVCKYLSES